MTHTTAHDSAAHGFLLVFPPIRSAVVGCHKQPSRLTKGTCCIASEVSPSAFYNTPSPPAYAEYGDDANTGTLPSWAAVRRAMDEPTHPHASQSGNYRLCPPFDYQPGRPRHRGQPRCWSRPRAPGVQHLPVLLRLWHPRQPAIPANGCGRNPYRTSSGSRMEALRST